jgi:lysophospholipase L1-like esterase
MHLRPLIVCLAAMLATAATGVAATAARQPIRTILFVGNSITQHAPAPELGWDGNRGMAASDIAKDYVHLFAARIAATQGITPEIRIHAKGGGTLAGKISEAATIANLAKDTDLIIVQLGENDHDVTVKAFQEPYDVLLQLLQAASPSARIVCTGVWAPPLGNGAKDRMIRALCQKYNLGFADLASINAAPANAAGSTGLWTHKGVNWHPSDAGMSGYAAALWAALSPSSAATAPAESVPAPSIVSSGPLFQSSFVKNATEALAHWGPAIGVLVKGEKGQAMELRSAKPEDTVMVRHTLPVEDFRGRTVVVTARIRTVGLTKPANPWNGVKVRFYIQNAEGKNDFPQASIPWASDSPWQTVTLTRLIPDNTVNLAIDLGLERVAGSLLIEELTITPAQ